MNNYYPNQYGAPQMGARQIQDMFPQPQGSVYQINTPSDIGNVPIGSTGLSVAICFSEQVLYIKSFQNGSPIIMAYHIEPYSRENRNTPVEEVAPEPNPLETRLAAIEQQLAKLTQPQPTGGKFDGLL